MPAHRNGPVSSNVRLHMHTLNGWRRLGIIISVIWILTIGVYSYKELVEADTRDILKSVQSRNLVKFMSTKPIPDDFRERFQKLESYDALTQLNLMREAESIVLATRPQLSLAQLAAISILPIIFGWLLVEATCFSFRWVRRGFSTISH